MLNKKKDFLEALAPNNGDKRQEGLLRISVPHYRG